MAPPSGTEQFDLIVVGAGPAGSAAALSALRVNPDARVLLLDREPIGRDKVCGDGIAPHAVSALAALGVDAVRPGEIVPSVRLVAPGGDSNAAVTGSPGYVIRRRVFDERLVSAAIAAGAQFRRERVTSLVQQRPDGVMVQGDVSALAPSDTIVTVNGRLSAPVVIAADGSNSVVRRLVGQQPNRGAALAVALRGYAPTPAGSPLELTLRWDSQRAGGLCYAWAFPLADGMSNVGYGMSSAGLTGGRAQLEQRLAALLPEYNLDGVDLSGHTLPLTVSRPEPAVGRVLLTGDAASLVNPFTGEGIFSAITSGALAGQAALRNPVTASAVYRGRLARRFGRQYRQTTALYPLLDHRLLLDAVIRSCGRDRRNFDRVLEVGLGDASFTLLDIVRFGRHIGGRAAKMRV
ncbi:MAG: geranylgeranyl reductase family protein [Glaciihabitans sp.]|nr:geranylgeranyl reductase family protein [Glaciihabitans sp.]